MKKFNFNEIILEDIKKDEGKKYILFLLNSLNQKPILGKTKLMKELFFISNNIPSLKKLFNFEADNYGPSSDVVSRFLEDLNRYNLVYLNNKHKHKNSNYWEYSLTDFGKETLNKIEDDYDRELINDMKTLFDGLTTDESLAITYFTFPEMTEESLVKEKIEKKREKLGLKLYKKNKVSLAKASQIAGMSINSFLEILKKEKIPVELSI